MQAPLAWDPSLPRWKHSHVGALLMKRTSGHLLFVERSIAVTPTAVKLFGLAEAVFLQQLNYRICSKKEDPNKYASHFIDGRYWVYWSMDDLRAEVPLGRTSTDPYKRVIKRLRALGILLVEKHRQAQWDRTNWYSIDQEAFDEYVATHAGSSRDPSGGNATNRDGDTPATVSVNPAGSTGGKSAAHRQSENSSKTSNKTTTTTPTDGALDNQALGGGARGDLTELDLSALPAGLRERVERIVRTRSDAQRFVDLLAKRLERDGELPAAHQLKHPLLWLRRLIERPCAVDFREADRLQDERDMRAKLATLERVRIAAERDARLEKAAADLARRDRAQSMLADMCAAQLARLKSIVLAGAVPVAQRSRVADAIDAGKLPDSPLVLYPTLRALETIRKQQPGGAE